MNDGNKLPRNDFARITRHEKGQADCLSFPLVRHKEYCRIPQAGVLRQKYGFAVLTNRNSNSDHGTKNKTPPGSSKVLFGAP